MEDRSIFVCREKAETRFLFFKSLNFRKKKKNTQRTTNHHQFLVNNPRAMACGTRDALCEPRRRPAVFGSILEIGTSAAGLSAGCRLCCSSRCGSSFPFSPPGHTATAAAAVEASGRIKYWISKQVSGCCDCSLIFIWLETSGWLYCTLIIASWLVKCVSKVTLKSP